MSYLISQRGALPRKDRARVSLSAYSRSPPTGMPVANRVTDTGSFSNNFFRYRAVVSPSTVGFVAIIISCMGTEVEKELCMRWISLFMLRDSGPIPSKGESSPPRT